MLDGVYRSSESVPVFLEVLSPTAEQLQVLLGRIITRIMKRLTRAGYLIEEAGMTYLGEIDAHSALMPLQAASCTYRIAFATARGAQGAELANAARPGGAARASPVRQRARL